MASNVESNICITGTWPFSFSAVENASRRIAKGEHAISAVEKGINLIEEDASFGCYQLGYSGYPNSKGDVEMDAAIMLGKGCQFGGVGGVKRVKYPISLARKVLQNSPHSFLVGDGAREFAIANKVAMVPDVDMQKVPTLQPEMSRLAPEGHDTLALVAVDRNRDVAAGVTTSGKKYKYPGRVGDSPLPGGGLYADNDVGGAVDLSVDKLLNPPLLYNTSCYLCDVINIYYIGCIERRFLSKENLLRITKTKSGVKHFLCYWGWGRNLEILPNISRNAVDEPDSYRPTRVQKLIKRRHRYFCETVQPGFNPEQACEKVVKTIARKIAPRKMFEIGLIAVDKMGNVGAATSISEWTDCKTGQSYPGFPIVVWHPKKSSEVLLDVIAPVCI